MLRKTGPGKISDESRSMYVGMTKALLYNFDIDGDEVKEEHRKFLWEKVVPLLKGDQGHIWMQGSASRSGSNKHNKDLSERRVKNIGNELVKRGISNRQMQLKAVGEALAQTHAREDELDRAVLLVIHPVPRESPPPPKQIPPPPPVGTQFKIRALSALGAGVPIPGIKKLLKFLKLSKLPTQGDVIFFQIVDLKNRVTAFYTYVGVGVSKDLSLALSASSKGQWSTFRTTSPIRVSQFAGPARFHTAGGAWWSIDRLSMMGLPQGVSTIPPLLNLDSGFTFGLGASSTEGKMYFYPEAEMIYNGD